jgi:hypothetical protein
MVKRGFLILIIFGFLRVIQSCCNCSSDPILFDIGQIELVNLDNTGERPLKTDVDIMHPNAVAFQVYIGIERDSYAHCEKVNGYFMGFPALNACKCFWDYYPNQKITHFSIKTLTPLKEELKEGDDVTEYFLASHYYHQSQPYITIKELIKAYNMGDAYFNNYGFEFKIFFKELVENESAQFEVTVELSDGRMLTAKTNLIAMNDQSNEE